MNIYSLLSYHALPAFLKLLVLKNNCICNQDNACDIAACPDNKAQREKSQQIKHKSR